MEKDKLEKIINDFWEDKELQEAITYYGEWNNEELNKEKDNALSRLIKKYKYK